MAGVGQELRARDGEVQTGGGDGNETRSVMKKGKKIFKDKDLRDKEESNIFS